MSAPGADGELSERVVAFAREHGANLDPEQELVLRVSVRINDEDRWQCGRLGVNLPRQNGKGEIAMWRELFGIYELGEKLVIHTAHEFKTSEKHFERLENTIRNSPALLARVKRAPTNPDRIIGFRYSHGDEAIELQDGCKIEFKTRTKGGMRGFDKVAILVLDEAHILDDFAHSSMFPIVRASDAEHGPQIWYMGSAVDQETHDKGVVFTRVREVGIQGSDQLAYFEWSLDYEHPDDVPEEVAKDPKNWYAVNFALGRRVTEEWMRLEFDAVSWRGFLVELLGVGDYPATDLSPDFLISPKDWADLLDPTSTLLDPICLAWDISPERNSAILAAGRNDKGQWGVEVVHANAGTGWVPEKLMRLYETHEIAEVVCDGFGPAAAVANRMDEAGITVRRLDSGDYGKACGFFVDAVGERTLRHLGQQELDHAINFAKARPLVDRWAWSRTKSTVNISPLVAATLALWSAQENDVGEVAIF
jgi:phage terminase large subunit-like protein